MNEKQFEDLKEILISIRDSVCDVENEISSLKTEVKKLQEFELTIKG